MPKSVLHYVLDNVEILMDFSKRTIGNKKILNWILLKGQSTLIPKLSLPNLVSQIKRLIVDGELNSLFVANQHISSS